MFRKLLCRLGLHDWVYVNLMGKARRCACCGRHELKSAEGRWYTV